MKKFSTQEDIQNEKKIAFGLSLMLMPITGVNHDSLFSPLKTQVSTSELTQLRTWL